MPLLHLLHIDLSATTKISHTLNFEIVVHCIGHQTEKKEWDNKMKF